MKVNYEKTTIYRVGLLHNTNAQFYTTKTFVWKDPPVETLGITVCTDHVEMAQCNLDPIIKKMTAVFEAWTNQDLTLKG